MKITAVTSEDQHGRSAAVATLADGTTELLFTYYADELSFTEAELVGLTVAQARSLRHRRDVAYLQS